MDRIERGTLLCDVDGHGGEGLGGIRLKGENSGGRRCGIVCRVRVTW